MFLRFDNQQDVRTIDLNSIIRVHKLKQWGSPPYLIRVDTLNDYDIVANNLSLGEAGEIESKIIEAWTKGRSSCEILEI